MIRNAAALTLTGAATLAAPPAAANATLADLGTQVAEEMERDCQPGTRIEVLPGAMELAPSGTVTVYLKGFTCPWVFATHPYCNDTTCEVRDYRWTGVRFELIRARLE